MATSDVREQLQTTLGDAYHIERELPPGGMSRLFLATERSLDRQVVIKLLPPEYASEVSAARFQREVTLTAHLQHPHILPILSAGSRDGLLYYVMPYVEGESLRQRLEREGSLPVPAAVQILRDVADALARAHKAGVVHRDIKPENILLQEDRALLADFGVARALHEATGSERLTETGTGLGTPGYMAPEQLAGDQHVDARADVYALAVVGYEMLAGVAPFTGPTPQAVAAAHFTSAPTPLAQVRPDVPPSVGNAVARALSKDPDRRFATAAEFRDAVSAASTPDRAFASRRRTVVAGVAAGLLVLMAGAAAMVWRARTHASSGPPMLAVLPFDNQGDSANAYFADGIADEIRGKLAALPTLRVIATTSSNQYRHTQKSPEQIGRELGVHYLLTGSVAWAAGANGARRVRVSPELVQITAGDPAQTKWHQSFDTTLADIFAVQTSVATLVSDRIGIVLGPDAQARLAAQPTQNIAAYDAYLRSTALIGPDPATVRQALAAAENAVALDSGFAQAWARIGYLHAFLYGVSVPTRSDSVASVRAAERAIALAPTAEEGYEARGTYKRIVETDEAGAIAAFRTAIQLAPSSARALVGLAISEDRRREDDSVLLHLRRAKTLDPRDREVAFLLSAHFLKVRHYSEARAEASRGLSLAPSGLGLIVLLVETYLGEGDLKGARSALRSVPATLDRSALVAYIAYQGDLCWVFDSSDRAVFLSLPVSAYDNGRAPWAMDRAELHWLAGNVALARAWADTARRDFEARLRAGPDAAWEHLFLGLALAYLGRREAAIEEVEKARTFLTADPSLTTDPSLNMVSARIYVALGDSNRALDALEQLLATPNPVSTAWLRIDPHFAPLRGNPRFDRLIAVGQ